MNDNEMTEKERKSQRETQQPILMTDVGNNVRQPLNQTRAGDVRIPKFSI